MYAFKYDHPLDDGVRRRVMDELAALERRRDVRVLFACESGSRAWGFASPDSDYDVRFLYVHRPEWYLRVERQRDVIEQPLDDELDVSGWELRKALQLLNRSNPTLFEWLQSPLVYRADEDATAALRELMPDFHSLARCRWHYLSMARKHHQGYLQGETVRLKKYLYVLRPLLAVRWLDSGRGLPPMRFADLAAATVDDARLADEINHLLAVKMAAGEARQGPRLPRLDAFIAAMLAEPAPPLPGGHGGDPRRLDALLRRLALGEALAA
ncbi:nucleotidyltransferase domain-containing protein [Chromobacterium phragmitis]|uniref:Nucleotidyltransferase n=1 Tax=Chromobacterium phragmitis TaxID=2202141 RepID=A0A344ULB0_9NEIS|nr:nucleotidyltransferase domain-containing protein [Chromobacterium phragmitis]AXE36058.1 nucleotidyltransferase [Chromobacterium phragmitis]